MSFRYGQGSAGDEQSNGVDDEQPKVVVRDKRRIDPVTGKIRVPPSDKKPEDGQPSGDAAAGLAGGGPSAGTVGGATAETAGGAQGPGTEELDALRSQLAERTDDLQRITAEYSNYRRRVERDRQAAAVLAKSQVASELLPVLDDIERAAAHGDLSGTFKVVADKLITGLAAHGLEPFGATGDEFDPDVHEAVQHSTSSDVKGPTVTTVLRRGYRFGERVLRPAMVAVTDAEPSDDAEHPVGPETTSRDAARFPGTDGPPADPGRADPPGPDQER